MARVSKKTTKATEIEPIKVHISHDDAEGQLPIDILEKEHEILIQTPIAGVDMDKTEIIITNDVLTIKGQREPKHQDFGFKEKDYYVKECYWGTFSRSIILPANVDASQIEATQDEHVLYVRIPKKARVKMRIVKIQPK